MHDVSQEAANYEAGFAASRDKYKLEFGQKRRENFNNNIKLDASSTATKFEIGTPHFANIIALNTAIKYISKIGIERRILSITDYLVNNLQDLNIEILPPIEEKIRNSCL